VTEHGQAVLRVCRAILGPQDAEDAWSETFLAALRAYPKIRPDSNVRAWLVTIAHRKAIDGYRAARRAPSPTDVVPDRVSVGPGGAGPGGTEPYLPDEALGSAVRALPFKQRAAVAYRYLADMSYQEIADLLDSSEAAARRSAADGIAALRQNPALRQGNPALPNNPDLRKNSAPRQGNPAACRNDEARRRNDEEE
jgi:DNA-directed RNA polymerase specialized sigma24 family protein